MDKALKNQIRTAYADQLRAYILANPPADWQLEFGEFPPKQTAMRNYVLYLLQTYREGDIYEAIKNLYGFNGSIRLLADQVKQVNESNQHKAIENFFKGTASKPELLQFLATIFRYEISLAEFEKSFVGTQTRVNEVVREDTHKGEESFVGTQTTARGTQTTVSKKQLIWRGATVLFVVLFLGNFGFEYYQMANRFAKAETTLALIDSLSFEPKYLTDEIAEKEVVRADKHNGGMSFVRTQTRAANEFADTTEPLLYFTNNIYNKKFIYTTKKWNFETDPKGEDINSEYGKPYNEEIRPLKPIESQSVTIANGEIWIRFNLKNNSAQKLYIDNLYLKIVGKYALDSVAVSYNAWLPKANEQVYEIELDNFAQTYPFATFTEISPDEARHFSLKVKGSQSLEKQAVKFQIYASCNDGNGKRYTICSDKIYVLGLYALL